MYLISKNVSPIMTTMLVTIMTLTSVGCSKKSESIGASASATATSNDTTTTTAPTATEESNNQVDSHEQLGTKWGDEVTSQSTQVEAKRMTSEPIDETQVRYAAKTFKGKSLNAISLAAGQVRFTVEDSLGNPLPLFRAGQSYYVTAQDGQSYQLHYQNNSDNTYEIVSSVDGIDVLNGSSASRYNAGYVLEPHDTLVIEGFRKSAEAVASFTFSKPSESYANHNASGSIDNTGIIGTVVYELQPLNPPKPNPTYAPEPTAKPNAFPGDK